MNDVVIRPAAEEEAALLVGLIRELAEAEEFPFPLTVTEAALRESLFGKRPAAEALLALKGGEVAGFAVFYETFATSTGRRGLHLDDLFVRPAFQGMGLGSRLLRHVAAIATSRGCARFEWWALRTNSKAIRFYENAGARAMEELLVFRAQGAALERLSGGAGGA